MTYGYWKIGRVEIFVWDDWVWKVYRHARGGFTFDLGRLTFAFWR